MLQELLGEHLQGDLARVVVAGARPGLLDGLLEAALAQRHDLLVVLVLLLLALMLDRVL